MNELEKEILENICSWEGVDHPECIGDVHEVAKQFEIPVDVAAKALKNLVAFGFIEERKARHSTHHDEQLAIKIGLYDPNMDSYCSTKAGRRAVSWDEGAGASDVN